MEREVEDGLDAFGIGLNHLPGFGIGQVFIADAGEVHGLLLRIAEAEGFEQAFHFGLHALELLDGGEVALGERAGSGDDAVVVFLRELKGAVHEVAVDGHKFVVVARLEVSPSEVVVLRFGGVGGEDIAHHVLFAGELLQIFVEPHRPVARGRDFVVLQVEKLVARHVVGQDEGAFGFEHGGEHDAVEHDVVLADEVDEARIVGLPPLFPRVGEEFFGVGNVADGRVKPNVEHLALSAFYRHGNAPIEVAAHGTRLQSHVKPTLALAAHVGAPFGMTLNPRLQPLLVLVEGEVPVLRLAQHGFAARHLRFGVDEFGG